MKTARALEQIQYAEHSLDELASRRLRRLRSDRANTKIVCTIGPKTSSPQMLFRLARAGMNVARLNLAHGKETEHIVIIHRIRRMAKQVNKPIGILFDVPGPKIRVGKLSPNPLSLRPGQVVSIVGGKTSSNDAPCIPISHSKFTRAVNPGDLVCLADGTIRLKVEARRGNELSCRVVRGGSLYSGKGVNVPGKNLGLHALTPRDISLLRFALQQDADFIGLSFTTSRSDITRTKKMVPRPRVRLG